MAAVSEIRAVDESTVEIEFSEPAAYFESALGLQPVVEPAFLDKMKSEARAPARSWSRSGFPATT